MLRQESNCGEIQEITVEEDVTTNEHVHKGCHVCTQNLVWALCVHNGHNRIRQVLAGDNVILETHSQ